MGNEHRPYRSKKKKAVKIGAVLSKQEYLKLRETMVLKNNKERIGLNYIFTKQK